MTVSRQHSLLRSAAWRTLNQEVILRPNTPCRPCKGPPQLRQVISRSVVGRGEASTRTLSYFAPQLGHLNDTDEGSAAIRRRFAIQGLKGGSCLKFWRRARARPFCCRYAARSLNAASRNRSRLRSPAAADFRMRSASEVLSIVACSFGGRRFQASSKATFIRAIVSASKWTTAFAISYP